MAEVTVFQLWLMLFAMAFVFLLGLCWCFCCGTCVGRSMLRNTGLFRFARDGSDNRQWRQVPQQEDEEEAWHLQTWTEQEENQRNTR